MRPNESLPKLLRAIAGGADAKASRHDIIFSAAADEIERLWAALCEIADGDAHYDGAARFMEIAREALTHEQAGDGK